MTKIGTTAAGFGARIARYFPDHEIYVRSNGRMRFVRISTSFQIKLLAIATGLFLGWLAMTLAALVMRIEVSQERAALGAQARSVSRDVGRVTQFRSSVESVAGRVERRQHELDLLIRHYFGAVEQARPRPAANAGKVPGIARLDGIAREQSAFARAVTQAAGVRIARAETALRRLGIDPARVTGPAPRGLGGPLVLVAPTIARDDPEMMALNRSLARLDMLERALVALPATRPTGTTQLASDFGMRFDPFTGQPAMHTGLDFPGAYGQPIFAASPGIVRAAGSMSGYGNVVIVDNGHGIETRYGHLSGFDVRPGMVVTAGQRIARMGSTGRSTGTHLHFEVRVNGRAVNPRPFLEASSDVLEIQASAGRRIDPRGRRS